MRGAPHVLPRGAGEQGAPRVAPAVCSPVLCASPPVAVLTLLLPALCQGNAGSGLLVPCQCMATGRSPPAVTRGNGDKAELVPVPRLNHTAQHHRAPGGLHQVLGVSFLPSIPLFPILRSSTWRWRSWSCHGQGWRELEQRTEVSVGALLSPGAQTPALPVPMGWSCGGFFCHLILFPSKLGGPRGEFPGVEC